MKKKILLLLSIVLIIKSEAQTWAGDVARIIYANCTPCHHSGGLAPSSFMTYQEAEASKTGINFAVTNRIMPPWPADPNYRHYAHEMVLSATEIATIQNWVANGAPQGNMAVAPAPPVYNNTTQLGTVDLSLTMQPYTITSGGDVYRNFVLNTNLTQTRYATAIEVIPGNTEIVHHVLVFMDTTNNTINPGSAGGTGSSASKMIYGYVPGSQPYFAPPGTGFRFPANTRIILQVHYAPGSQSQTDQTTINFKLTSTPQRQISVNALLNHFVTMTNGPINIPANQTRTYYEQFPVNTNYTMLYAWPHMHVVGRNIITYATTSVPNDTVRFVNVPDWDFHWQQNYVFANTQKINSGSMLKATAFYDNTTNNPDNPNSPPQTVTAGEGTGDEMMMVFFAYMPYQSGDENLIVDKRIIPRSGTTFCNGQSVLLETIEGNGYTYQWLRNGSAISGATSSSYIATQPGNYTVSITLGANNAVSDAVTVTVNSPPVATITPAGPTTICNGQQVTLNANTGAGYTYQWYKDGAPITIATSPSYVATATGSYTVEVNNGCTATSAAIVVSSGTGAQATVTANGSTTFCAGGSVQLSAPAGNTYVWSNGATTQTITATQAGTYVVTVTNGAGCSASSTGTVVSVNQPPAATVTAGGPTAFCPGGSVQLSAPAGNTYVWSTGATTQSITAAQPGTYTVTVTNSNNCTAVSSGTAVSVYSSPTAIITPAGATQFCTGGSVLLTASGGTGYTWSNGSTATGITASQTGSYTVTVTNQNGCTGTAALNVTVYAVPDATITTNKPTVICPGDTVLLTASPNAQYAWNNGATIQSQVAFANGTYQLTVTDNNGCTAISQPVTVTVNNNAVAGVTPSGATTFCAGQSVTLTASQGNTYLWSTGATTPSITVNQSGSYTVTVVVSANCTAQSVPLIVTVNNNPPVPTITASGALSFCEGKSVALSAPAGYSYLWSTGTTDAAITVTTSDTYLLTVTDINGCSAVAAGTPVTVYPLPDVTLNGNPDSVCLNSDAFQLQGGLPLNGTYTGQLVNQGLFTPAATGLQTIQYSYTDNNGCTNSVTENIEVVVCTGINKGTAIINFSVYPNPVSNILQLQFDKSLSVELEVFDVSGRRVAMQQLNGIQHTINVSLLAVGFYQARLKNDKGYGYFSFTKQ